MSRERFEQLMPPIPRWRKELQNTTHWFEKYG
jgi:hypothetical protein